MDEIGNQLDSQESILLAKLGTQPELSGIVDKLSELMPSKRFLGIQVAGVAASTNLQVIAHERQLVLGAFPDWWNRQLYVDPDLYVRLQGRESQLLRMAERVARHDVFQVDQPAFPAESFNDGVDGRSQLLLRQIAFWDWILRTHNVQAVVSQNLPHNFWDAVLHAVVEAREIPYLYFHEVRPFLTSVYFYEQLSEMGDLRRGREMIETLSARGDLVADSLTRGEFMRKQVGTDQAVGHQRMGRKQTYSLKRRVRSLVWPPRHLPYKAMRAARRRWRDSRSRRREQRVAQASKLPSRYFLLELQIQGNATNLVKGYMYGEPREMVAHVANSLPEGCYLLVRESSRQGSRKQPRREYFWKQVAAVPRVHVISDEHDSSDLLRNSVGLVELGYSSLAMEAINLGVPVVVLGLTHLHGAPKTYVASDYASLSEALRIVDANSDFVDCENESTSAALHAWADDTRAATIEGSLTSYPRSRVNDPYYRERLVNNVAQVVAAWYSTKFL